MQVTPRRPVTHYLAYPAAAWLAVFAIALTLTSPVTAQDVAAQGAAAAPPLRERWNVLFISVDDLRPQLRCYGHAEMETPAMDRLASEGRLFERHYVQVPTCGGARAALLTGRYPARPGAYENGAMAMRPPEEVRRDVVLPQLFLRNGYTTVNVGKIAHEPDGRLRDGRPEVPDAWDEVGAPSGKWGTAWNAFFAYADGSTRVPEKSPATERADVPDDGYPDGLIANAAIAKLRELKERDQPFFLAVGFYKPHLPFNAPKRYWDLYDPAKIPAPAHAEPPSGVDPDIGLHKSGELTPRYTGLAKPGVVTEAEARHLRHGYAACVSYIDAQVGKVLDELDRLGLRERTVVVVWGDHGWHLGEHGIWGKHTLHEIALRAPLIIRTPRTAQAGKASSALVECVDIYPTLAELCGLTAAKGLDGKSFVAALADPAAAGKEAAYGFWARGRAHSIRTDTHRLTEWRDADDPAKILQVELYDHESDPNETRNVADQHPRLVAELTQRLHERVPMLRHR